MTAEVARRKKILVAEDDPAIRALLARAFHAQYEVVIAEDGNAAIARASETPPPDLILLDVMMPGIDGFGVAQRIRMLPGTKKVPIIFITAKDHPLDQVRGIQVGARHYITKPFKLEDVMTKVRKALGA